MKIMVTALEVTDIEGLSTNEICQKVRTYVAELNGISVHEVFIGEPYDPIYAQPRNGEWMGFKIHPLYEPNMAVTPSYRYYRVIE